MDVPENTELDPGGGGVERVGCGILKMLTLTSIRPGQNSAFLNLGFIIFKGGHNKTPQDAY